MIDTGPYSGFIVELDNVLYPERDYLLQVYYLFAQFMEYTEQQDAAEILEVMQSAYHEHGPDRVFGMLTVTHGVVAKYRENFDLLHKTARLPLKLLLFKAMLTFLQQAVAHNKIICVLADGDPEVQLNKIRQIEWNGLERSIRVFFTSELGNTRDEAVKQLLLNTGLLADSVLVIDEKF